MSYMLSWPLHGAWSCLTTSDSSWLLLMTVNYKWFFFGSKSHISCTTTGTIAIQQFNCPLYHVIMSTNVFLSMDPIAQKKKN
jgi:hypothetical protein